MRVVSAALLAAGCASTAPSEDAWEVVWQDEFQGAEGQLPDPANWSFDVGGDGWGNQQLEYNTDRPENVSVNGDGFLRIVAQREDYEGNAWTSGRIKTQALQAFEYGKIEARIKLPSGRGIWPAFWMLGEDIDSVGWPSCGEIDVVEMRGEEPDTVFGTIHGPTYAGGDSVSGDWTPDGTDFGSEFFTYAVIWDPEHIVWTVNGELLATATPADLPSFAPWVFDHPFFLLLNVAVGGTLVEEPDATTPDSAVMAVDYVRVLKRVEPLEAQVR